MKYILLSFLAVLSYATLSVASANEVPTACTMEYAPVCAQMQVQCVRAPCYPIYRTYSNECMMSAESNTTLVHTDACTAFEESTSVVLSERLKTALRFQFDRFAQTLSPLSKNAQLTKFQWLDDRINARLAITPGTPMDLNTEMKADKVKYALRFLQDATQTSIWNLEEEISGKRYLFRDPVKCEGIKFRCMAGESSFSDEIGCGCEK